MAPADRDAETVKLMESGGKEQFATHGPRPALVGPQATANRAKSVKPQGRQPLRSVSAARAIQERGRSGRAHGPPLVALAVPGARTGRVISAFAPFLLRGFRLYCLDGGNVFNPYRLAVWARGQGWDPAVLLERVFVSRAYTCHQLVEAVESMLEPLGGGPEPPLAALLGIEQLFLDEDIPLWERRYLFDRILDRIKRLHRTGLPILVTFGGEPASPWVRRLARVVPVLSNIEEAFPRIGRGFPGSPRD